MKEARAWSQLRSETLIETPWLKIARDVYVKPDGSEGLYTYVDIPGSTMTIPVLESGELILVRQWRYLMQRSSLEFPAGGLKPGMSPLEGAEEELREEAGYAANSWEKIGEFAPYNGVSNEYCHVFIATGLEEVGVEPESTEEIEVARLTVDELRRQIVSREIWDGMTINCFALYELRNATK